MTSHMNKKRKLRGLSSSLGRLTLTPRASRHGKPLSDADKLHRHSVLRAEKSTATYGRKNEEAQ